MIVFGTVQLSQQIGCGQNLLYILAASKWPCGCGPDVTVFTGGLRRPVAAHVKVHTTLARGKLRIPYKLLGQLRALAFHDYIVSRRLENLAEQIDIIHHVKLGITGWAQINGRNALTWEQKFACDLWYVDHRSLSLDLRILCRTLWQVWHRVGISFAGHATMPAFMGRRESGAKECGE